MGDTYTCFKCKGVFSKGWSDDEAILELNDNFPGFSIDDCDLVCDDCHIEFMEWMKKNVH